MFGWISRQFVKTSGWFSKRGRFDLTEDHRLNSATWQNATDTSINTDIATDLATARQRALLAAENNPWVAGVIQTHATDLVGSEGPALQIESDDDDWNERAEQAWRDFWEMPDFNGELAGVELLELWIRNLWTCGEFLIQKVIDRRGDGPQLKILDIHPRRLKNPFGGDLSGLTLQGVERNRSGRPVAYHIEDFGVDESILGANFSPRRIRAEDVIHGFKHLESGQARGWPWLGPSVQAAEDVRDFDNSVLHAARAATKWGVLLFTDHQDAQYIEFDGSVEFENGQIRTMPPGWRVEHVKSEFPQVGYTDYRHDRMRELGRPVNMPAMIVKLDSGGMNFSSARMDATRYHRGNQALQGWLARKVLNVLLRDLVADHPQLRRAPARWKAIWTWPAPASIDPQKEAKGWEILHKLGVVSESEIAASLGKDIEAVIAARKRYQQLIEAAGLTNTSDEAAEPAMTEEDVRELLTDLMQERALWGLAN